MNRDDVIDVLSVVAAASRRTVGETDVQIWSSIIGTLPREVAMEAVSDHLRDRPGVWMEPGHVYQRGREIIRNRSQLAVVAETKLAIESAGGTSQASSADHRRRLIEEFAQTRMKSVPHA